MAKKKLLIVQDPAPQNPREAMEPVSTMVCWHKRYTLGDEQPSVSPKEYEFPRDNGTTYRRDLYLYDHSGVTISTSPFSSHWDSGWVGFVYIQKNTLRDMFGINDDFKEKAHDTIDYEVTLYDHFLRGNVWGYKVVELCDECGHEKEEVDSCWGFYGDKLSDTVLVDHVRHHDFTKEEIEKAWDARLA